MGELIKRYNNLIRFLTNILYKLYNIKTIRKGVIRLVVMLEGGQVYSKTLRRIASSYHKIQIGMYTYGSCFSFHRIPPGTEIGRYCSFAEGVVIFNGNHPYERKSTHPFFYNPIFRCVNGDMISRTKLMIGNDVWLGFNVVILPSVSRIGDGAVIGAYSVVTKNVPPFAVVAGNPARIIKYRFPEEKIEEMIESAWWNKDIEKIKKEDFKSFLVPLR